MIVLLLLLEKNEGNFEKVDLIVFHRGKRKSVLFHPNDNLRKAFVYFFKRAKEKKIARHNHLN